MQLTINITKKNKDKIFKLIDAYLEDENLTDDFQIKNITVPKRKDYLQVPPKISGKKGGKIAVYISKEKQDENKRLTSVGSWGQFNSFFPIKAALRILINYSMDTNSSSLNIEDFVNACLRIFKNRSYNSKRGFPSSNKDTAKGRFVWHFLSTAYEMGLIRISRSDLKYNGLPRFLQDWENVEIDITAEGIEFAILPNNLFDQISEKQILTEEERNWAISYLKKIDQKGYKEYTMLNGVYLFLKEGHNGKDDLWDWFRHNDIFIDYIKSWSRKAKQGNEKALVEQIETLSTSFASSKVALLRELGVVNNKRNNYEIIGEF